MPAIYTTIYAYVAYIYTNDTTLIAFVKREKTEHLFGAIIINGIFLHLWKSIHKTMSPVRPGTDLYIGLKRL